MRGALVETILRLYRLGRRHRPVLMLAFVCMVVLGLCHGIYAWLLGPVLRFLLTGGADGLTAVSKWVNATEFDRQKTLWFFPLVILVIGAVKGVAYLGQFYFSGLFGQRVAMDIRRHLFQRILELSPRQASAQLSGDILARFTSDVTVIESAASYTLASYFRDSVQLVFLVGVAFSVSWKLSLFLLAAIPLALGPARWLSQKLLRALHHAQATVGAMAGQLHEGIAALPTLQVFNAREAELARFRRKSQRLSSVLEHAGWLGPAVPSAMELLAAISIAAVLGLSSSLNWATGEELVSVVFALVLAYQPAKDLGRLTSQALQAAASFERLDVLLRLPLESFDQPGVPSLARASKSFAVKDVHFEWAPGREALAGVTLEVPLGKTIALVGESGSGKSTLLSLLMRFAAPKSGCIEIDGRDISTVTLQSVRQQFSWVTQEPMLMAESVRENVRMARPSATDVQIEEALIASAALDFVKGLPKGLDTVLGERGVTLSGGQRQKLCLARALLSNAPILLLDEVTRSLDAVSAREVQKTIDQIARSHGRTVVMVAHRLESVTTADCVYVLERGRIVESGPHDQLMKAGGRYSEWVALSSAT